LVADAAYVLFRSFAHTCRGARAVPWVDQRLALGFFIQVRPRHCPLWVISRPERADVDSVRFTPKSEHPQSRHNVR